MFNIFRRNKNKKDTKSLTLEDRLEIAKQQLIFDLEKNGMEFLISKMASNKEYSELVLERRKIDLSYCSEDSESWYAYRQSDKLNSQDGKEELFKLLSDEKHSEFKKYIYCCLSSICSNTNDKELFNFLIDKVQIEDDERIKVSILSRLRDVIKDSGYNIEPIKILVAEGTADESHAAIEALSNTNDPEVEHILLEEFKITSKHMKGMICGPLSTVGTVKSIPILKEAYKKTRDGFLRMVIDDAVYKIETRAKAATNIGFAARLAGHWSHGHLIAVVLHLGWTNIAGLLFVNLYLYIFNQQRLRAGPAMNSSPAASLDRCASCYGTHSAICKVTN